MAEPFYIRQTFEPDHLERPIDWFRACVDAARAEGGTWPRATWRDDGKGLLFECWKERPDDQGEPRWSVTLKEPET